MLVRTARCRHAVRTAQRVRVREIDDDEGRRLSREPEVVFCLDEFGPLHLQPHPGRQWAERGGKPILGRTHRRLFEGPLRGALFAAPDDARPAAAGPRRSVHGVADRGFQNFRAP
ncbi:hypothetical protein PUR71_35685 [Streptomyces sp. SP17BM10]|uniref:hypothetical protein n=1 Tax=Streptomyces sp. SP17BM10 TaxID=3002530 RepID=UPI002E7CB008|nr:hypothetical protein [Streptomyces sp. SP17BM10]